MAGCPIGISTVTGTVMVAPGRSLTLPIFRMGSSPVGGAGRPIGTDGMLDTVTPAATRAMPIASLP